MNVEKYGKLTVLHAVPRPVGKNYGKTWVRCRCECGTELDVAIEKIKYGQVKSCGCIKRKRGADSPFWKGYGKLSQDLVGQFRRNARVRGIEFSISIEQLWDIFEKQNGRCALSGIELSLDYQGNRLHRKKKETSLLTASIDRIDNSKGYVDGNVQWIHKHINIMKNEYSQEQFVKYCKLIAKNHP